jgi:voltage-gated potassium channel
MAVVDLAAVLPFYLPFLGLDLMFLRSLRLVRIARLGKLNRYSQAMQLLGKVVWNRRAELASSVLVLLVLLVVVSSLMYYAERDAQPDRFGDIPSAMWWGVATLTTIGYGDTYPVTALGKALATVAAVLGIGMFALPTGILGSAFVEELQARRRPARCPHCGKELSAGHPIAQHSDAP